MAVRDNVRDQPGSARASRALQASARAHLVRRTAGNAAGAQSASQIRQRARAQRAQGPEVASVAKVFGNAIPPDIAAASAAAGMDASTPFSPGAPLSPYDGFSTTPRSRNFVPQYNVSARPRSHERVAFSTLRGLIDAYDFAQICIWHRIDSLRALEWSLVAADRYTGDVSDAVSLGMAALKKPDRKTPFDAWLAKFAYDILAYDAGALWRMRNRAGQSVGLKVVDGTTLAPLLDDWGDQPQDGAPAFVQYINGLPWNWLTTDDLIYEPFRQRSNTIYGTAPLESILLNANTDLRFQAYFLQRFTEGNLPAAFASAPESWTPQQIEQFQEYWDSFILGDQSFKSQIRWIPPGSKIEWSNEKDFTDAFSLFMMRKTASAYHVVPADLGFTENVNKSSGETQSDVQHRVGDVPLAKHIASILTAFLQDDLHLPVKFVYDFGEEQDDRLQTAQADDIYVKMGAVSNSDIRELRFGLPEPNGMRVPRFIFSNRGGPIPLSALEAVAGPIDPESGAPAPGAPLPHKVFQPIEGVEANPPTPSAPLAVKLYGPEALPVPAPQAAPAPAPAQPQSPPAPRPVEKEGAGAAGITAATGITSYDLVGHHGEEEDEEPTAVAKELAAYRRFAKARRRDGKWRDFQFETLDASTARSLNEAGRHSVVAKQGSVPGLTKRSGMISLDLPAGLVPTVPGGVEDSHITVVYLGNDLSDEEFGAACDRAEAAAAQAPGPLTGTIAGIDSFAPSAGSDGMIPAFVPVTLPGVDALRDSLADLSASEHRQFTPHVTLKYCEEGEPLPAPVPPTLVTFTHLTVHCGDETRSFRLGSNSLGQAALAKAAAGGDPDGPKADASAKEASSRWPGWDHDEAVAEHWAKKLTDGYTAALSSAHAQQIAAAFIAAHPSDSEKHTKAETAAIAAALLAAARAHLEDQHLDFTSAAATSLQGLYADAYLIGAASGNAAIDGGKAQLGNWKPGKTAEAHRLLEALALGTGLSALLLRAPETAAAMSNTRMAALAGALAAGAAAGQSAAIIAGSLIAVLQAGWRSLRAAVTEVTAGSSAGAGAVYRKRSVTLGRWALDPASKSCAICIANADAKPRPVGEPYPSGHSSGPVHDHCRCQIVPA